MMTASLRIAQWPTPIAVAPGQTLLDAALAAGVPYPHGCRSGNCGACKSRLHSGEVSMAPYSGFALTEEERAEGYVLACRARSDGPVELGWLQDDSELAAHPLRRFAGRVVAAEAMTHDISRIRVAPPEGVRFDFSAGQYATLTIDGYAPRDYSMANRPDEALLEFHVRALPDGTVSRHMAERLAVGDSVRVEGPFGSSFLRERHRGPILAIAGGSGLAPVKSVIETALAKGMPQPIYLYFGVRDERDLYLDEHFRGLAAANPRLRFTPVLSEPSGATTRRTGLVSAAVGRDFDDLDGCKAYVAGPPVMVEATARMLETRDMRPEDIHADAFYTEADKAAMRAT